MASEYLLKPYLEYNVWANQRIVNWLKTNSLKLLEQELPTSFPTIKKTLEHILSGQVFYLSIIKETPFEKGFVDADLLTALVKQSEHFAEYLADKDEAFFQELRTVDSRTMQGDYPIHLYVQHCINHSTYHRGQVVAMGRALGMSKPPSTDFIYFQMGVEV